jgi:hypothetical protein
MSKQDGLVFSKAFVSVHLCRPESRTCPWISGKNPCGSTCRGGEGGGPKKIMVIKKNENKKKTKKKAEEPNKSTGSGARLAGSSPTKQPFL